MISRFECGLERSALYNKDRIREDELAWYCVEMTNTEWLIVNDLRDREPVGAPPLVTIVVVNYNYARFIEQCIRSVAAQDYRHIECLILDCASTDGSAAVIQSTLERLGDPRFKFRRRDFNRGQLANALSAINEINGAFVNFLDADDLLFPEFVSSHVKAHLNDLNPAAVTVSDQIQIDAAGHALAGTCAWHQKWRVQSLGNDWPDLSHARSWLPTSHGFAKCNEVALRYVPAWWSSWPGDRWIWSTTSAMMFRSTVIARLAPGEAELEGFGRLNLDGYYARFAHSVGGTLIIDAAHGAYRRHGNNVWSSNPIFGGFSAASPRDEPGQLRALQELARRVLVARHGDLVPSIGGELYYSIAWQLMSNDDFFRFAKAHEADRVHWEATIKSANVAIPSRVQLAVRHIRRRFGSRY